jgi:predicted SAM-dependent methyltransferase
MLMLSTVFHTLLGECKRNHQAKLRIIVGACEEDKHEGWIATSKTRLDLLREADWANLKNSVDAILAEHVWEQLDCDAAIVAAQNCFKSLKPGGYIRVAVPDGLHPVEDYINRVRPGEWGAGSDDHHVLYTYRTLKTVFESVGFQVTLLEYFDERGIFHHQEWTPADGMITRSARFDSRNFTGELAYTSIIMDARRPVQKSRVASQLNQPTSRERELIGRNAAE